MQKIFHIKEKNKEGVYLGLIKGDKVVLERTLIEVIYSESLKSICRDLDIEHYGEEYDNT